MGRGLYPKAPDMRLPATQSLTDGELFAIIRNGSGSRDARVGIGYARGQSRDLEARALHSPPPSRHRGGPRGDAPPEPRSPAEVEREREVERFLAGEGRPVEGLCTSTEPAERSAPSALWRSRPGRPVPVAGRGLRETWPPVAAAALVALVAVSGILEPGEVLLRDAVLRAEPRQQAAAVVAVLIDEEASAVWGPGPGLGLSSPRSWTAYGRQARRAWSWMSSFPRSAKAMARSPRRSPSCRRFSPLP